MKSRNYIYSVTALLDYLDDAHVIGPSTTADLDGDGLPDDCDIADAVILLRSPGTFVLAPRFGTCGCLLNYLL